jgi:integrase
LSTYLSTSNSNYKLPVVLGLTSAGPKVSKPSSIRLYDLRHTCATLLLSHNIHPKYVQELLGHASIAQTLDTYSHIIEGMDGGITEAVDEALG